MNEPDYDDAFIAIRYALDRHQEEAKRIRRLVLEQEELGFSRREIGRRIGVKATTLQHWVQLAKAERAGEDTSLNTNLLHYTKD
ncbi:hypothetical protein QP735_07670 [Curtobacterium citreum]|uniref:hypothetical protein n=1 Tax=Curtobacterium citreum TaxID=2036 RepID=UPI00254C6BCF|nr:hypothetical protein [Curtobacterium citreum]MDK8172409.1 hypothetical protein [Curtobacterium citreum]